MPKPSNPIDSRPYCELLLAVCHNLGSNIEELKEQTGKKRSTLVEQLNKLHRKKIVKIDPSEKKYAYKVNYDGLGGILYYEILGKGFGADEKLYPKELFFSLGLPGYIEEAFLSLKKKPETTIRELLAELVKSTRVNNMFFRMDGTETPDLYFDEAQSRAVEENKKLDTYLRLRMKLAQVYYAHVFLKSKEGIFSKFIDSKMQKKSSSFEESVKRVNKLKRLAGM